MVKAINLPDMNLFHIDLIFYDIISRINICKMYGWYIHFYNVACSLTV